MLIALCRPFKDSTYATPATNQQIADELVVSVDAVKSTLRALFEVFGVDALPQNQKRASLALQAMRTRRAHPPRPVSTVLSLFSGWLPTHKVFPLVSTAIENGFGDRSTGSPILRDFFSSIVYRSLEL